MSRSRTNNIFYGLRLLTTDADEGRRIVDAFRVYPYARRADPLPKRIVRPTGGRWLQAQPAGLAYFRVLAAILDREPVEERDLFFAGIARSLGMERGKPFAPDERTARILTAECGGWRKWALWVTGAQLRARTSLRRSKPAKIRW